MGRARWEGSLKKYCIGIVKGETPEENPVETVSEKQAKSTWARLMVRLLSPQVQKVYEINPFVCPKCVSDMRVVAVITNPAEISRILEFTSA